MYFDPARSFSITDRETEISYNIEWLNRNVFSLEYEHSYVKLDAPFDPTNTGGFKFNANDEFTWNEIGASFISDVRKSLNFELSGRYGGYFTGTRLTIDGEVVFTGFSHTVACQLLQPIIISYCLSHLIALNCSYSPRFDFTFTDRLFLTSFLTIQQSD
jgi:hypothetical protein